MPGLRGGMENEVLNLGIRSYRTVLRRNVRENRSRAGKKLREYNTALYIPTSSCVECVGHDKHYER